MFSYIVEEQNDRQSLDNSQHFEEIKRKHWNTGTVSKATLGKHLRDGLERIWAFPRE